MRPILEIQGISKKYRIRHASAGYLSLRERMVSAFKLSKNEVEDFWALRDVSFQVQPGESIGIIGRNGAGKSTLLKVLSKITPPTSGKIFSRGRIASLLEVGTGFHPELTGCENIFFNGSLLGMKRKEIQSKFDEIVDFSGVEKFLDTPLKHYSSGMQLRLAFAVAAFLEPEILIIDEVLAVGDAEFQKKCMGKMEDVTGQGRTVLFVSHNLPTLRTICKTGILLQAGVLVAHGSIDRVIEQYTLNQIKGETIASSLHYFQPDIKISNILINGSETISGIVVESRLDISFKISFNKQTNFELDIHLKKEDIVFASYANFVSDDVKTFGPGTYQMSYSLELDNVKSGWYKLDLYFTDPFVSWFALSENIISLELVNKKHHTFLNSPTLKWGSVMLAGRTTSARID